MLREALRDAPDNLNLKEKIIWLKNFIKQKENICNKYNIEYESFHYYLIGAIKNGFCFYDDIKDIEDYFKSKNFYNNSYNNFNKNNIDNKIKKDIKLIKQKYIKLKKKNLD